MIAVQENVLKEQYLWSAERNNGESPTKYKGPITYL